MNIPDSLPVLSSGHHSRGSGNACIMDAISYISGDSEITDMPACVYPTLAKMAQNLNDHICTHTDSDKLCSKCSHTMWMIGQRLVGSNDYVEGLNTAVLNAKLTIAAARSVLDKSGPFYEVSLDAIKAAELYIEIQTVETIGAAVRAAKAARDAAWAAEVARGAAGVAEAVQAAAWAAEAVQAAAWANKSSWATGVDKSARAASWAVSDARRAAERPEEPLLAVIDKFEELTEFNSSVKYGPAEYSKVLEEARLSC